MQLKYYKGNNFGDALNPLIFDHYLPDFFDENPEVYFLGIGSIMGLFKPNQNVKKAIVFSSGIAGGDDKTYGAPPSKEELFKYDIRCVRGPRTARALGVPLERGICDGAILLPEVLNKYNGSAKKYKFSYMPHLSSLKHYSGWEGLLRSLDINLIDPTKGNVEDIVKEINQSEVLIAEAMHGAIIADTYRIPWIPVKTLKTINHFKWTDFCESLNMTYQPHDIPSLYNKETIYEVVETKTGLGSKFLNNSLTSLYSLHQGLSVEKQVKKAFLELKTATPSLSELTVLNSKRKQLKDILEGIKKDYSN